jgi:hypothetical protein
VPSVAMLMLLAVVVVVRVIVSVWFVAAVMHGLASSWTCSMWSTD